MPNMFGGPQDHPAYDDRRKLNPKTELLIENTLYVLCGRIIEAQDITGYIMRYSLEDFNLPNVVRDYFNKQLKILGNKWSFLK